MFNIEKWMNICSKYGAKFNNIQFVLENENFVKAIAIEREKPIFLEVPFPCLAWLEEIELSNDVKIRYSNNRPKEVEEFLYEYLYFILSESRKKWLKNFLFQINNLPENIKIKLKRLGLINLLLPPNKDDFSNIEIVLKLLKARTLNTIIKLYLCHS